MKKPKYLNNKDPWYLGEDIPDMDLFFSQIWLSCFGNELKYPNGRAYQKIMTIFKGYHLWFYFGKNNSYDIGEHLVSKFLKQPQFTVLVNKKIIQLSDKIKNWAEKLPTDNLNKLSNKKLWEIYKKHDDFHTEYYQWGWIPVGSDMFHNNLTERFKEYLRSLNVSENKINEYFIILTQPRRKSLIQIENEEFLQMAKRIQSDKYHQRLFKSLYKLFEEKQATPFGLKSHTPEYEKTLENKIDEIRDQIKKPILKMIEKYYQKYFYVKFMWIGKEGVNSLDYYIKELVKFIGRDSQASKSLKEKIRERKQILEKRQSLIKKLKIKGKWLILFDNWGDFMLTKIYRRYAQIYVIYRMQIILDEITKRLKITKKQIRFMIKNEVYQALIKNKIDRKNLKERTKFCVYHVEKSFEKVYVGKKAKKIVSQIKSKKKIEQSEIKGQTGCIGKAQGIVRIILRPKDMVKMKKGDILVSIATDPDIVLAMKKAAAIVTEQGGITSHAAIVSREMNIPCVIGTRIATKVLKDGDLVEVDANKGIVKKL
jgi:phosphohistidine swiveling domain-containing protein